MLDVCERCEIKEKFTYGKKILQRKQLQFSSVYVHALLLYARGVCYISIWVHFMASHMSKQHNLLSCAVEHSHYHC